MKLAQFRPIISKDKTYFRKVFHYIAATTFVLFFFFTLIITMLTIRKYTDEMENSCIQSLDASITVSEAALESLYHYCYFLFNNNPVVNDILYADSFSSDLSIEFAALKDDFLNYYSLIDSIYLVNFQADMAFSNKTTCHSLDTFYDQNIISVLKENTEEASINYLFMPRSAQSGAPSDVISLIFRSRNNNAFVINLSLSSYESLLNQATNDMRPATYVINGYGCAIIGNGEMSFTSHVAEADWYQKILSADQSAGKHSVTLDRTRYTVFYRKNADFRFTYLTMLNASPFSTNNTMLYSTLLSFTVFTFLGLGLALFLSYTLYLPISNLTKLIRTYDRRAKGNNPDDLSYLQNAVTELVNTSRKNEKRLVRTRQAACLRHILTVADYYNTIDKETLADYEIHFEAGNYQVVLFSLDRSSQMLSNSPDDYRLMLDSLQNIASELLSEALYLEIEDGILAYILFPESDDPEEFLEQITRTKQCMDEYFKETVTVGIGLVQDSPGDLHVSYTQAKLALRYRFLSGDGSILNYETFSAQNRSEKMLVQEQKDILASVLAGKETAALEKLQAYFAVLRNLPIDNIIMNITALHILFQNTEAQSELRSEDSLSYDSDPYNHFTIDEIMAQFARRISSDIIQLQEIRKNVSSKPQIIEEVTSYVETNLRSPNLTVEAIAAHVQLSTNYLRNIFKEHMGITLSKYITDKKIQYACKILAETDDSIQSICEQLDFTSANYFYTYFKKNTGMTPSQYRETYRSGQVLS